MHDDVNSLPGIAASERSAPPEWALWQRYLIDALSRGAEEFASRYARADGTLIWRHHWPGMDGSDDPYEGFMNMPLLYALGGSDLLLPLSRSIWDGITWQWTEYGQIADEFDGYYDWMHHGEGNLFFYFLGLADPGSLKDRQRAVRFASLYNGTHPKVKNYDSGKRMMLAPLTGSRGPRFVHTEEDWSTHREILNDYLPPFEDLPGLDARAYRCPWTDDAMYRDILRRMNERQARGDVPLNLIATTLAVHAFMYTQDETHARWVIDYTEAWAERTAKNDGITPDNIGLRGIVGEYNEGKWWGGYYGWRWPHGAFTILEPLTVSGLNALLLTGDSRFLRTARSQYDLLWSLRQCVDGEWKVPNRRYDDGWDDYRLLHPMTAVHLWNASMEEEDAARAERMSEHPLFLEPDDRYGSYGEELTGGHMGFNGNTVQWFRFIRGRDPEYPLKMLRMNARLAMEQLARIRTEACDPHTLDHDSDAMAIHRWQEWTPAIAEALAQLTWGGPMHVYHGGLQIARLRYYDAERRRPGLPPDVAALVTKLEPEAAEVELVNTSFFDARELIAQAGMFGEHAFTYAESLAPDGPVRERVAAAGRWLRVRLPPGTSIRLRLGMQRYAHRPSYATPFDAPEKYPRFIKGRSF